MKKTTSFLFSWDYGEIFIFNAWIRAKLFLTSLKLREFAPAGTETKSPTLHHARLLSLAGDLACWLHHTSCSAPPTSSFHGENLFSRAVFRVLFTRIWNDGVVWLENGGKSDPLNAKTQNIYQISLLPNTVWTLQRLQTTKLLYVQGWTRALDLKMLDNKSEQNASAVIQPLACNPWDLTMSFTKPVTLCERRGTIWPTIAGMRGKERKSALAAGGIEHKPAQMGSSGRRQQSRRCVTTGGGNHTRVWVSQSSPKASASNFLQLQRLRPITRHLREGRAQQDCQV